MTRLVSAVLLAAGLLVGLTGCPDDPYSYKTWTKKLGDQKESERAQTQLEQLGNPDAIPALGDAWLDQGKPVRLLQIIIGLSRPLTAKQADDEHMTDYDGQSGHANGRPASWDKAMPYLSKALLDVDEANPRSVDSAQKAADALGEAKLPAGLDALIDLAAKPVTKKLFQAQVAAIRAMGKFDGDEKAKAAAALLKIIDREPPPHPRTAKDKETGRSLEEKFGLFLGVTGASINSLSELRVPSATSKLVLSLYRTPELFTQVRRALVASGPTAEAELRKVLRGEHAEVNQLFKDLRLDKYCGDKNDAPQEQCQSVSAKDFYPAVVLGDFYDPASVPDLLVALRRPALPVYYQDDQPSPNTQYNAIFDALRKIGAPEGAPQIHAMWAGHGAPAAAPKAKCPKGKTCPDAAPVGGGGESDLGTKILAIQAYPFLTRDDTGAAELGAIAADNKADDNLRTEAALAFARLSHDKSNIGVLEGLAQKYFDASDKKRKEADGKFKTDADAADKEFEKAKKKVDEAKSDALKATHDPNKGAAEIKAATENAKKAEDELKVAKAKHKAAVGPFKGADAAAKAYKGYARMFQTHIARIEVAIRCKDINCFADTLKLAADMKTGPDKAVENLKPYIKDLKDWGKEEKLGLLEGEIERAMLELGKQGQKAGAMTDALLEAAKSDDRLIRQSILLALPKIAKVPCANCEAKLDVAIKAGEGKTTLGDLNLETTMLRNYFAWAGGKTPSSPTPDAPAPTPEKKPAPAPEKEAPAEKQEAPAPAAPAKAAPAPAKAAPAPAKAAPAKPAAKPKRR
ncbi:MAG: lyase domain protein repeat-containing protein [Myxococcales bacterium]|nr:lyase domain protein repeat-containing protein [Myxococcales bacterium]